MPTKTAHIISHSHWDREWYMPYEKHHVRLVELIDTLIDLFENDPQFRSFHLDGQTIVLEDYLQVRPERKELIKKLVREGRFQIGPWYVLQDEFLTSSEANIRNLLMGHRDAKEYGDVCKIGYFPDSFGNMGQAPQILRQAGIDNAVFGRGVKPIGFNNEVLGNYESAFSEMNWQSPDGSTVLGILFANWYNNGMEIPTDPSEAAEYWKHRFKAVERFTSTPHLLFMNGCDHQPAQRDLSAALKTARELYPDVEFIHSNFLDYVEKVKTSLPESLSTVRGELRSQRTDGWFTLANTASARVYIKQANQRCQTLFEKVAEPLAAFAGTLGHGYPHHLFAYGWKTLMQNHPHDSICGCSVDEVHSEMMTRFAKSQSIAEEIVDQSLGAIARNIDTATAFQAIDPQAVPFTVFNTSGWNRSGLVSVDLEIGKARQDQNEDINLSDYGVVDSKGLPVDVKVEDLGFNFGYTLPKDRFRQPYFARTVRLTFTADDVPAMGYKTYAWVKQSANASSQVDDQVSAAKGTRILENEYLKVEIHDDGSYDLTDKRNGRTYKDLGVYEDTGDIGNEYIYCQPKGDAAITTRGAATEITLLEKSNLQTVFEIVNHLEIPVSADDTLEKERHDCIFFLNRKAQRSPVLTTLDIKTKITLEQGAEKLRLQTTLSNKSKDHRVRVLFPTDTASEVHRADSIFEVAVRDTKPSAEWKNPSNCQHQQAFVNVSDDNGGLTVANLGLNEYEVLRDGRNTIALTLLRAVGELGDWGYFPTPEAQCIGGYTFEYAVIPHTGGKSLDSYVSAYQEQIPWIAAGTSLHSGSLPADKQFVEWSGKGLAFSSLKLNEGTDELILRWYNMTDETTSLQLACPTGFEFEKAYKSNVLEEKGEQITCGEPIDVRPAEIVTLRISR